MVSDAARLGRIQVLDILRALAIFGMIVVHFDDAAVASEPGNPTERLINLFMRDKAYLAFAILFGVSFALILRRAEARLAPTYLPFLRRLATILVLGVAVKQLFGFRVLITYAGWGVPLLLVRSWSTSALVGATIACSLMPVKDYQPILETAPAAIATAAGGDGPASTATGQTAPTPQHAEIGWRGSWLAAAWASATSFVRAEVLSFSLAPLSPFLIGALALRLGVWERPRERLTLIIGAMITGVALWALAEWPAFAYLPDIVRSSWLALTYMGAVLLLVEYSPTWARRLGVLRAAGQLALTNYVAHIVVIDFVKRALGAGQDVAPELGVLAAVLLFSLQVIWSRWWLARFQFGPAEWLVRCATDLRVVPITSPREHFAGG